MTGLRQFRWVHRLSLFSVTVMHQDSDDPAEDEFGDAEGLVVEQTKPRLKRPPLYKVLLLNDDYTPMDFVVSILQGYFSITHEKSVQIMMNVHQRGVGVCGIYPREVAETKVEQVMRTARDNQHPLQCVMEPESDDHSNGQFDGQ